MRIPEGSIIPHEKLTKYLLVPRPWDDKSKFLAQAGFSLERPEILENAIRTTAAMMDALEDGSNEYGTFYRVEGLLQGPEGDLLQVVQIWLEWRVDGSFHFVTLKPAK